MTVPEPATLASSLAQKLLPKLETRLKTYSLRTLTCGSCIRFDQAYFSFYSSFREPALRMQSKLDLRIIVSLHPTFLDNVYIQL
jgi:hypothetical protein